MAPCMKNHILVFIQDLKSFPSDFIKKNNIKVIKSTVPLILMNLAVGLNKLLENCQVLFEK